MKKYLHCLKEQLLWLERVGNKKIAHLRIHTAHITQKDGLYMNDHGSLINLSHLINPLHLLEKESEI